jgi:DNA recombination-dependent growth factor C
MGLFTGSISYVRYTIQDAVSENVKDVTLQKLKEFSFKEIDPISLSEKTMGWVSAENMASTFFDDLHFSKGPYLVFSFRIDVRRIPALTQKAAMLREEIKYKKDTGKEQLFKKEKDMLRDEVYQALIKKMIPTPSIYDVCWNTSDGSVLFFSNSLKANEEFISYFHRSFDLKLSTLIPTGLAALVLKDRGKQTIDINNLELQFTDG